VGQDHIPFGSLRPKNIYQKFSNREQMLLDHHQEVMEDHYKFEHPNQMEYLME